MLMLNFNLNDAHLLDNNIISFTTFTQPADESQEFQTIVSYVLLIELIIYKIGCPSFGPDLSAT